METINYAVHRHLTRKVSRSHCCTTRQAERGKLFFEGQPQDAWEDENFHRLVRQIIEEINPGWIIGGYCFANPLDNEEHGHNERPDDQ